MGRNGSRWFGPSLLWEAAELFDQRGFHYSNSQDVASTIRLDSSDVANSTKIYAEEGSSVALGERFYHQQRDTL